MRKLLVLLIASFVVSCGTVAPKNSIPPNEWVTFNHKTSYYTRETGKDSVYLNVKYGSYTFTDKSAETVPIAKSVFKQIANELAKKHGKPFAVYDVSNFYESVAYNGITGISTVLVSNDIMFTENLDDSDVHRRTREDGGIVKKLENLKEAFEKGLITKQEYEKKKKEILEQYRRSNKAN